MTALVYADLDNAELVWSPRAAVFEFILSDVAAQAGVVLKAKIEEAIECEGWNVGDLASFELTELLRCAKSIFTIYCERARSRTDEDPDYKYLADSLQEMIDLVERVVRAKSVNGSVPE